jgi:acetyl esterase/lipase
MRPTVLIVVAIIVIVIVLGAFAILYTSYHSTVVTTQSSTSSGASFTQTSSNSIITQTSTVNTSNVSTTFSGSQEISDVAYCTIDGMKESLDVYIPNDLLASNTSAPLVIYVHGGGWVQGDKGQDWNGIFEMLLENDFVVASINYYLAPASPPPYGFPINIEDSACALRYLRANAIQYHIEPNHVGLLGDSAGGNLVSLLALASLNGTFDNVGGYSNESDQVQAVVDCFGPANMTAPDMLDNSNLYHWGDKQLNLFSVVFDNSTALEEQGSPAYYVTSGAPPFLIEQGMNDTTVPMDQSIALYNALESNGDNAQLILVQNAGHEFAIVKPNSPQVPSLPDLLGDIVNFYNSELK